MPGLVFKTCERGEKLRWSVRLRLASATAFHTGRRLAGSNQFEFSVVRLHFRNASAISFPGPLPANSLRGALGLLTDPSVFAPKADGRTASGLQDPPRPFVFRARHLAARTIPTGAGFHVDVHCFLPDPHPLVEAFSRLRSLQGTPVDLAYHQVTHHRVELEASSPHSSIEVRFESPTELKQGFAFAGLFAAARDRISNLRAFYGGGPLSIDFRELGALATEVETRTSDLVHLEGERTSTRTNQRHPLGGWIGSVRYEGKLDRFLPYLDAACWTGVGRQTVWGKGEIRLLRQSSD